MSIRILELRSVWGTGGGPEKTILLGARRHDRTRFDITVCYLRDARDETFRIDTLARTHEVDYVEILERHSFDRRIWSSLRRLVRDRRIDIVHAHDYKTDLLALLLGRAERVIPLATAHGWSGTSSPRERFVYYPLDRRLLARYPRVIAVSPEIREALVATGSRRDRVSLVLNGVDPEAFRRAPERIAAARAANGLAPGDFAIGALGRLDAVKRMDLLIEAVGRLAGEWPGIRVLIAGDGGLRESLERLAAARAPGRIRFLGQSRDVVGLHHALDAFVQASDYEGSSNALLEAMAMETAVVATDVGGTSEMVRDEVDGLLVPPGDVAAMVAAIRRTMADPDATRRRVANARERVETTLSFAERTRQVEAIYEELVASR